MKHRIEKALVLELSEDEARLLESIMLHHKNFMSSRKGALTPSERLELEFINELYDIINQSGF